MRRFQRNWSRHFSDTSRALLVVPNFIEIYKNFRGYPDKKFIYRWSNNITMPKIEKLYKKLCNLYSDE